MTNGDYHSRHLEWTRNFYYCHENGTCFSNEFIVSPGHVGKVRFFTDNDSDYCIEPQEGVSDCPCGPRKQWFPVKRVACDVIDSETGNRVEVTRPWVMSTCTADEYIELSPGKYRFCVLDCDYNPVVPGPDDILLRVKHCLDNRVSVINNQQGW